MTDFNQHLSKINILVKRKDGTNLAKELSIPGRKLDAKIVNFISSVNGINYSVYACSNIEDSLFAKIVCRRVAALIAIGDGNLETAYVELHAAYNTILEYFSSEDGTWVRSVVIRLASDLFRIAEMSDAKSASDGAMLRECLTSLTNGWKVVLKDRVSVTKPTSRKLAIFAMTNILLKVYFKLNTLQLVGKLVSTIEGRDGQSELMNQLRHFPVSDVVTYKYYIGRLYLFEDKYEESRECLRFALKYCPNTSIQNRRRILASLIPVEMCLGVLPSQKVATMYGLVELFQIGQSIRFGNINLFESTLRRYRNTFIRLGVYLVLEQAKMIVFRSLFKRISLVISSTRLNLHVFESVLRWLGESADLDEIECILCNLINRNIIKGYISHQKRVLMVSKADPFPTNAVVKKVKNS